jgi:triosephosphate isomerase
MKNVKEFVAAELESLLGRGFVATPACQEDLVAFAKANGGSMDMLLMQMAVQYGAKLAYENILENMESAKTAAE